MYKVIIVEDERKMARLIKQLGHWSEYDLDVIDICFDGIVALERIISERPDIVLTDIKMPGYDGNELIRRVREAGLETEFIIVSGYKHFEYAQNALQYGVMDYLLKPIDANQLNQALEKAKLKIADKRDIHELAETQKLIQKDAFWKAVMKEQKVISDCDSLEEFNQKYRLNFHEGIFAILCIRTGMDAMLSHNSLFMEKMLNTISKTFEERMLTERYGDEEGITVILNCVNMPAELIKRGISGLFYAIKNLTEIYGEFSLTIGCSQLVTDFHMLPELYRQANVAEYGRLIYGNDKIIRYERFCNSPHFENSDLMSETDLREIRNAFDIMNTDSVREVMERVIAGSARYHAYYPGDMLRFVDFMIKEISGFYIESENEKLKLRKQIKLACVECVSFKELLTVTFRMLEDGWKKCIEIRRGNMVKPIKQIQQYMEEHYMEQITQSYLAEMAGMSDSYFSKLFKEECGEGYSEYLIDIRLGKSKKLLMDTNLTIKEIAHQVGYPDEKYYSRLFQKKVGIKPKDFRNLYQ